MSRAHPILAFLLYPLSFSGVPPISGRGNVTEIARHFGGFEQLGNAVQELQTLLYAK